MTETQKAIASVIARRVKQLRAERGWSQEKVAREASRDGREISKETVRAVEAAERIASIPTLEAIAGGFDVSVYAIFPFHSGDEAAIRCFPQTGPDLARPARRRSLLSPSHPVAALAVG